MNPNLRKYNSTKLEIDTHFPIPKAIGEEIRKLSPPDDDGDSLFVSKHTRHQVWAWMIDETASGNMTDSEEYYNLKYICTLGRSLRIKKSSIEELFELLSPYLDQVQLKMSVDFVFPKGLKPLPILEIPNKYISLPEMPFDYIRGYHFIKQSHGKELEYDVIVDTNMKGSYFVRLIISNSVSFDNKLIINSINYAETIVKKFITLEKKK